MCSRGECLAKRGDPTIARDGRARSLRACRPCARAAFTQRATVAHDLAVIVDALTALIADDTLALKSRHLLWANGHAHPACVEQLVIRHFPICEHLLLILTGDLRVHLFRQRL